MKWQPIDTAPQGVFVLMCDMNAKDVKSWAFTDWIVDSICCGNHLHTPTHSMPLPEPPK